MRFSFSRFRGCVLAWFFLGRLFDYGFQSGANPLQSEDPSALQIQVEAFPAVIAAEPDALVAGAPQAASPVAQSA